MMMIKFAIKNILRYKSRSILTALVILVSGFSTVLIIGFMEGSVSHMVNGYVKYQSSHIRITTKPYSEKERFFPLYENISNIENLKKDLLKDDRINQVVPTFHFGGFIGQDDTTVPISIIAFDLKDNTFSLDKKLVSGNIENNGILMGADLQERLELSLGDKPLIVSTTVDSALNGTKPIIVGITKFGISSFDKRTIFMDLSIAQKLLRVDDSTTEIFIMLDDIKNIDKVASDIKSKYSEYVVETYKTQMGSMYSTMEMQKKVLNFIAVIIMFLGSLVIINSLVASIYERINEIGMLKALGYSNKELTKMLFFEGVVFGLFGGGIGFLIGVIFINYLSKVGIDLSTMMGGIEIPVDSVIYPSLTVMTTIISAIVSIIIPALVSIIPSNIIKRLTPTQALNIRR